MRRSIVAVMMFSAVVIFLFARFTSAEAGGGNCEEKLAGNSYICEFKLSNGMSESECVEFLTGGISADFDLFEEGSDFGCTCQVKGSFKSPDFDGSSDTFECVGTIANLWIGKVSSKKLTGQVAAENGESAIFTCTLSATACP